MNREHKGRQFGPALLCAVLALFSWVIVAQAQYVKDLPPPPPPNTPKPTPTPPLKDDDFEVIKVSSNLIIVPVSVVDRTGQAVHGLPVTDFRLEEEGKPQQIVEIGNPDSVPLDIALLFDISSSVSQKGFFEFQQQAAARFLRQVMKPTDQAAVFTIGAEPLMIAPLGPAETAAVKLASVPAATSRVSTSFYDTVAAAAAYLEKSQANRRKVIVVISDGDDTSSELAQETRAESRVSQTTNLTRAASTENLQMRHRRAIAEVQRVVQKSDAAFYSINPGGPSVQLNQISMRAQRGMETVAKSTGGTAFIPDGEKDLERVFNEVAAELRGQYLLQYYSNSQTQGTAFRTIKVSVPSTSDFRVRARLGYYPKQK